MVLIVARKSERTSSAIRPSMGSSAIAFRSSAVVHREVANVSARLLATAHFTDHVATLTGRVAAERLRAVEIPLEDSA
jgi:hypothetical protein